MQQLLTLWAELWRDHAVWLLSALVLLAFALGLLFSQMRANRERRQLEQEWLKQQAEAEQGYEAARQEWLATQEREQQDREMKLAFARRELEQVQAFHTQQMQGLQEQQRSLKEELQLAREETEKWRSEWETVRLQQESLESRSLEREKQVAEQLRQLQENREQLRQEFENLSNQIFEAKGKAFSEQSRQSLDLMLKPFREQLGDFKTRVEDIHHRELKQKADLSAELQQLKNLNQQMTQEAHELSTALRGQKKVQGNWGELMLENVLDRSGLQLGQDYHREVSFDTEDGKRRPDVIVNLPQNRHLVIDAKVSLNAYQDYVNAEDESQRALKLKEHVAALSSRIQELSSKRYFDLPGLRSPEIVFMFVPIESAFVEALKADEELFQRALQRDVLVATPTTLLTSLNIVRQLWRFEAQSRSSAELADKAAKVYEKLRVFLDTMTTVGGQIEKAHDSWRKACNQLSQGKGNLLKQALEFKELGVAVKSELPEAFTARAELELPEASETGISSDSTV